ncbi:hypothetical protein JQ596_38470 [Bradyrhizobium manausense]|uniref:hypothetical protein n=1 Tax=Bradyrhizobium manausense TaxID=989370 RepID=UPI001BA86879|nr:hypothetical protein [Bradyrhizobium manausense]MBR0831407.1 hypothetical protein [Bradyrhizobium manausense]
MDKADDKPPSQPKPKPKPRRKGRMAEALRNIEEYAADLRELISKLRRRPH